MKLNATLDEENSKRFQEVKEYSCLKANVSVMSLLISKEYNRIQRSKMRKVFLPKETYVKVEKAAEKRGQTIYEYVDEITSDLLKQAPEGLK
jgi:hypothetical protein